MSELQAEPTSVEPGSISAKSAAAASPEVSGEPAIDTMAEATAVSDAPDLVPEAAQVPETAIAEMSPATAVEAKASELAASEIKASEIKAPEIEASEAAVETEAPKAEAPQTDAPKTDAPRIPGNLMIMAAADRGWDRSGAGPETKPEPSAGMFGKRRLSALAAVVALAALAGAVGGSLATAGLGHFMGDDGSRAIESSVARIDADIQALKTGMEHSSRLGMSQFNKTNERLDKIEKAQAEPAAKLAKLSETVDKLRVTPAAPVVAAAAPAPAKEVTGSVTPAAAAPKADIKPEINRLPTVDSWALRDVDRGGALIEGRQGIFEVYAGDVVPGLGRIDAIRRQDGRWVVVTSRGLVVAR